MRTFWLSLGLGLAVAGILAITGSSPLELAMNL